MTCKSPGDGILKEVASPTSEPKSPCFLSLLQHLRPTPTSPYSTSSDFTSYPSRFRTSLPPQRTLQSIPQFQLQLLPSPHSRSPLQTPSLYPNDRSSLFFPPEHPNTSPPSSKTPPHPAPPPSYQPSPPPHPPPHASSSPHSSHSHPHTSLRRHHPPRPPPQP